MSAVHHAEQPGGTLHEGSGRFGTPARVADEMAGLLQVLVPGIGIAHFGRPLVRTLVRTPRIELRVEVRQGIQILAFLTMLTLEPEAPTVLRTATGRILTNVDTTKVA